MSPLTIFRAYKEACRRGGHEERTNSINSDVGMEPDYALGDKYLRQVQLFDAHLEKILDKPNKPFGPPVTSFWRRSK